MASGQIRAQDWAITVDGQKIVLAQVPLQETVRFELAHPAKIHGFAVQWENLPAGITPEAPLEAGLYRDFGRA